MSTTTLPALLKQRLQAALADTHLANTVFTILQDSVNMKPSSRKFSVALKSDFTLASTPGTWDWSAGGHFGRVEIDYDGDISAAHAYTDVAFASGTMQLELYLHTGQSGTEVGTLTRIGTCTIPPGSNDGAQHAFTLTSTEVSAGNYLHIQPTEKPGGSGWAVFVDVHFDEVST